jgi:DNA-binding IscR family transcriptional regulator
LANLLDDALQAFMAVLDERTLADVMEPRAQLIPLLRRSTREPEARAG